MGLVMGLGTGMTAIEPTLLATFLDLVGRQLQSLSGFAQCRQPWQVSVLQ